MHRQIISDEIFNEIKQEAIDIIKHEARNMQNAYYRSIDKINLIKSIENTENNHHFIIEMFDAVDKSKLYSSLSPRAKEAFNE